MQLRHERKMYPPRVKMTVVMKNPDTILKLPVRIDGCSSDNQLDTELTFPLGKSCYIYGRHHFSVMYNDTCRISILNKRYFIIHGTPITQNNM